LVAGGCGNDPTIEGVWQTHPEVAQGNAWTTSGVYEDSDQLLRRITPFPEEPPDLGSIPFGCDTEQIQERLAPELLAALTPNVDSDAGFRRQLRLAPPHDVVLHRARAPVVDERATFQWDAAVVREQQLIEGAQVVWASVDVLAARRLAGLPVRFERRHDRVDIAGRERTLIFGDDV
jgi:hypothetical protein